VYLWNYVFIWSGVESKLELGVLIIGVAKTHAQKHFRYSFQPRNITHINVWPGRTDVNRQFEDASVQFVVNIKEIQDGPPITHVFIRRRCVWFRHLHLNDEVG